MYTHMFTTLKYKPLKLRLKMEEEECLDSYISLVQQHAGQSKSLAFAAKEENLKACAIGDGNLNDIVRISGEEDSVVVKHAPPYIKCLGPTYPLSETRGDIEYRAMLKFHESSPGCVPFPYFYSKETSVICMEDLKTYKDFRKQLVLGVCNKDIIKKVASDIGKVHAQTHVSTLGEDSFQSLKDQFGDSELVAITEQFIFTRPFVRDDPTNRCSDAVKQRMNLVYDDPDVLAAALQMKNIFLKKKECLVHGDLHTGSIMVDGSNAKMIDLEFAYAGPPAFDVGILIANYIFAYYNHMSISDDHDRHRAFAYTMIDACKETVSTYLSHMRCYIGDQESYENNFISETAGFAGCEIIRRILGAAHVEDLEQNEYSAQDALGAGVRLLLAKDRIQTADRLMVIALMLA